MSSSSVDTRVVLPRPEPIDGGPIGSIPTQGHAAGAFIYLAFVQEDDEALRWVVAYRGVVAYHPDDEVAWFKRHAFCLAYARSMRASRQLTQDGG